MSSDQFKAVGIATAKGIGRGSKALGKAGYKTYKKNEAKRKGTEYVEPTSDGKSSSLSKTSTNEETDQPRYVSKPLPSKELLQSYQPPPRRNVGAYSPGEGKYTAPQKTSSTTQTQPYQQQQPVQQPQPYQQPQQVQQPQPYQQQQPAQQPQPYQQPQQVQQQQPQAQYQQPQQVQYQPQPNQQQQYQPPQQPQTQQYQQPLQYQQPSQNQQQYQQSQYQQPQSYQEPQQFQDPSQQAAPAPPQYSQPTQPVQQGNQPPPPPRPVQPSTLPQTQSSSVNLNQAQPTPFAQANNQTGWNQQQPQESEVQPQVAQPQYGQPQSQLQNEAPPPAYGQHSEVQQNVQAYPQYTQQGQAPVSQPWQGQQAPPVLPNRSAAVPAMQPQPQVAVTGQVSAPPSLPARNSTVAAPPTAQPVVGAYSQTQQPVSTYPSVTPVASNETSQTETEKPKRPLPDPTSFPPPPTRKVQTPDVTGASRKSATHSKRNSGQSFGQSSEHVTESPAATSIHTGADDNTLQAPALPSRTSANSVASNNSTQSKFDLNAFPPPPQPHRPKVETKHNSFRSSSRSDEASYEDDAVEDAPPMPVRPSQRTPSTSSFADSIEEAPPMPRRPLQSTSSASSVTNSVSETKEAIQKKKPPPKPVKKPKALSSEHSSTSADPNSQGVQSELENMFRKMNVNKSSSEVGVEKSDTSAVKLKPVKQSSPSVVKPKPAVKPKPQIKPKPVIASSVPSVAHTAPVMEQSAARVSSPTPPPAPKPRNYKRAAAPTPVVESQGPPNLDLELETQWFANTKGLVLPKSLSGLNYQTNYSYSTSGGSQTWNRVITLRLKDMSIVSYKFVWNASDVASVAVTIDRFVPSPLLTVPSKQEFVANHEKFGEYVASWSEHHKGQQVGSGECWDLAKFALEKGCGKHAFVSEYYTHGYPILQIKNTGAGVEFMNGLQQLDEIRRGDILQFKSCTFFHPSTGVTQTVGAPYHTSVVVENDGLKLKVVEQNVNNIRRVMDGEYVLKDLTAGEVYVYRPMPTEWAGSL